MNINYKIMVLLIVLCVSNTYIWSKDCCEQQFLNACEMGEKLEAETKLREGAEVNCKNSDNRTGLIIATIKGHKSICELLLACKARVDLRDKYNWNARMYAIHNDHNEIEKLLEDAEEALEEKE